MTDRAQQQGYNWMTVQMFSHLWSQCCSATFLQSCVQYQYLPVSGWTCQMCPNLSSKNKHWGMSEFISELTYDDYDSELLFSTKTHLDVWCSAWCLQFIFFFSSMTIYLCLMKGSSSDFCRLVASCLREPDGINNRKQTKQKPGDIISKWCRFRLHNQFMSWFVCSLESAVSLLMRLGRSVLALGYRTAVGLYGAAKVCWNPSIT